MLKVVNSLEVMVKQAIGKRGVRY